MMGESSVFTDVQAVLFDLDGTLIDSMPQHQQAWTAWHRRHGLPIDEATVYNETLELLYLEKNELKKLDTALRVAMADATIKQRLVDLSSDIPPSDKMTPDGLKDHLKLEINKWGPIIRKAGVSAD